MNTRQVESSAQQQFDNLQEQLNIANQRLWHVAQSAENVVGLVESKAQALETESEARQSATLQQEDIIKRKGNLLEETLHQERIKQLRTLEEGQVLEETLRQNMLQQSHHAQFQQNVDVKNQQLEAQLARTQQEKAESDSKLSQQNEQMDYLRAHYESNRIRDLSLLQANQSLHHVDKQAPAQPSKDWQPSAELRNSAGGNPTRTDEPTPSI